MRVAKRISKSHSMWMYNKQTALCALFLAFFFHAYGQTCDVQLTGFVLDLSTDEPIPYANIYLKESQTGAVTDSVGYFVIGSLCPGDFHLSISHIGCETQELFVATNKDTALTIFLDHNGHMLSEVTIEQSSNTSSNQANTTLGSAAIESLVHLDIAAMMEGSAGVSLIKNGAGISKPVIHGLYGNRVTILNNGVAQSGQQWGVDHSPEIDPLVANSITVIKGVGALAYQGSSLGSVVLVEPNRIKKEPHVHGNAKYFFESNGRSNGLNLDVQQYGKHVAWRAVGTLKKSGDRHTPDYFLNNTGGEQANLALQLEKTWNYQWESDLYFSSFNASLGVLRGAHIGNLTDLSSALENETPLFTEPIFSYDIDAPRQQVNHHLIKAHTRFRPTQHEHFFDFSSAGQINNRKEFDVRRSGRSDIPALSLSQNTHFIEAKYHHYFKNNWKTISGVQATRTDNTNSPETGILPLIPDYISSEYGVYFLATKAWEKTTIDFGARYDFEQRNVAAISNSTPREILRYSTPYHNTSAMFGVKHNLGSKYKWVLNWNVGYANRNPEVNELYSNGLHQGVSGIEEGDPLLVPEQSLKTTLSLKKRLWERFGFEVLGYLQNISNYIFLNPQDEIRYTIRGAFPVFKYEQTNAIIGGVDLEATLRITKKLLFTGKYSFLQGHDQSNNLPLVFMPANSLLGTLRIPIPTLWKAENIEININNRYVFKQRNLLASQDFVEPPPAYYLLGASISAEQQIKKIRLKTFLRGENLLNQTYRDYLNRQRYFADDLGVNLVAGINVSF